MKEIYSASKGEVILVDDEDYNWLNKHKWYNNGVGYMSTYIKINNQRKRKYIHRLIMNEPDNMNIDHIDGNGLNNQKSNLRIVTVSQNQMNRRKGKKSSSSKFKGVYFHKGDKQWISRIHINGKTKYLGHFKIEKEAAMAYNKAAIELFGEYAHLNEVKI